jgi:hypothetical protein
MRRARRGCGVGLALVGLCAAFTGKRAAVRTGAAVASSVYLLGELGRAAAAGGPEPEPRTRSRSARGGRGPGAAP